MHLTAYLGMLLSLFLACGCANQQPPGGGDEDKTPPKVKILYPNPNSLNFKGKSISFAFDEYVDRRSFQDAFHVSPQIKGNIDFNWSGKNVEVVFDKPFSKIDANKTFVVTVNTSLKDIHGNAITSPVAFAFATGNKIDEGSLAGKVYNNNNKNISIFAYRLDEGTYDPTKNLADYQSETGLDGVFTLTNLAPGKYRLLAIDDDDKNFLYTTDRESYGVLPEDLSLPEGGKLRGLNFYMKQINASAVLPELNTDNYFKDSLNIVWTSVKDDYRNVLPEQSIFIFFNKYKPQREDIVNNLLVKDENNSPEKMVFNWKNDSLVEVFSANKFKPAKAYNLSFPLKAANDSLYNINLKFRVVSGNSFGEMKGVIRYVSYDSSDVTGEYNSIKINLESKEIIPAIKYTYEVNDSVFIFNKILEADYNLFSFIDSKGTGSYNFGAPFPFEYSGQFFAYPQTISIKGGWTVENVQVIFAR